MNAAAQELARFAGAVAHQRAREPILEKARAMIPAGKPIPAALNPEFLLTLSDRLKGA